MKLGFTVAGLLLGLLVSSQAPSLASPSKGGNSSSPGISSSAIPCYCPISDCDLAWNGTSGFVSNRGLKWVGSSPGYDDCGGFPELMLVPNSNSSLFDSLQVAGNTKGYADPLLFILVGYPDGTYAGTYEEPYFYNPGEGQFKFNYNFNLNEDPFDLSEEAGSIIEVLWTDGGEYDDESYQDTITTFGFNGVQATPVTNQAPFQNCIFTQF
jgi:hypothetical protein